MTRRKARYCPDCGTATETKVFDGRERSFCPDCDAVVFQNPVPTGHVVVLDGPAALFVERGHAADRGAWMMPGGFLEVDESAPVGAARELEEETGLAVDPSALELVRTGFDVDDPADGSIRSICFAVERDRTRGAPTPGAEPADAGFWEPETLLASREETRTVDCRRVESAWQRLRSTELGLVGQ